MTYLPWTVWFFSLLPPVPVLIVLIFFSGFFILGLIMYRTSSDMSIDDLLSLIPRVTVIVRKHLNRGKTVGLFLILIGGLATATFADQANAQYLTNSPSGGGPALYHCLDSSILSCWTNGANSGTIPSTNSTLCNSGNAPNCGSCPSNPNSPCWIKGQSGVITCTIGIGATNCSITVTFSPAYTTVPKVWTGWDNATAQTAASVNLVVPGPPISKNLDFQASPTSWSMPVANTELNGNVATQRLQWKTPSVLTSQTGIFCVGAGTIAGAPQYTVQSSTDQITWSNMGTDGIAVSTAANTFTCTTEAISLAASTIYYFRIMGNDFLGPAADVAGTVQLSIYGTGADQTIAYNANCNTLSTTVTSTTGKIFANCGSVGLAGAKTFKVDWWSGVLG